MPTAQSMKQDAEKLMDEAVTTFQTAINTGVKLQEEAMKIVTETVHEYASPEATQKFNTVLKEQTIPATQKNMQEMLDLMNQNASSSLDLLKKSLEVGQGANLEDVQQRTCALWEDTLSVMRKNSQALVQSNQRIVDSFTQLGKCQTTASKSGGK